MEQQHDESHGAEYPRGRGYGHDYMRGGEVFGGYGYSLREEYDRPRGELMQKEGAPHEHEPAPLEDERLARLRLEAELLESGAPGQFPQDERAGGWEVPHDLGDSAPERTSQAFIDTDASQRASDASVRSDAPVPQIEGTFGDIGGNRLHSRSFYVTQAQLQQRFYAPKRQRSLEGESGRPGEVPGEDPTGH
jgi:hypothetical protein